MERYMTICALFVLFHEIYISGWPCNPSIGSTTLLFGLNCNSTCHCGNATEQCDWYTGHCISGCAAGWMGTGCQYEDLSIQPESAAGQNGTVPGFQPSLAVDNDATTCSKTELGSNRWWKLWLRNQSSIVGVSIITSYTEPDYDGYFAKFKVIVESVDAAYKFFGWDYVYTARNTCYTHTGLAPPTGSIDVVCDNVMHGNQIRIEQEGTTQLVLCDVKVQSGCSRDPLRGYVFGDGCWQQCSPHCKNNKQCHSVSGECPEGCEPGWRDSTCRDACLFGTYGAECAHACSAFCKTNLTCDNENGRCTDGCKDGWQGDKCDTPCDEGRYGSGCAGICSDHCVNDLCEKVDGNCSFGCEPGWRPDKCIFPCVITTWGQNCFNPCNIGCIFQDCNHVDGFCNIGCEPGYMDSTFCDTECLPGSYGVNCTHNCSGHCKNGRACDKESGNCPSGCDPGWKTDNCSKECEDGTWGEECQQTCGECRPGTTCDKVFGVCDGCASGYRQPFCKEECNPGLFGVNCAQECRQVPNCEQSGRICHPQDGTCDACTPGWEGSNCTKACDNGKWGVKCSGICGHCLVGTCDKITGNCGSGCASGYNLASKCTTECNPGTFGVNCAQDCRQFPNCEQSGRICRPHDGKCDACTPGWEGSNCNKECDDGRWGISCSKTCGHCRNAPCNKVTGECETGCAAGYKTTIMCQEVCPAGRHGIACLSNCSHCKNNDVCDRTNGHCPAGCETGYLGDKCDTTGNITVVSLYHDPSDALSGTKVEIVCKVVLVRIPWSLEFVFQWLFNGVVLSPGAGSRFSISSSANQSAPEHKQSILTIDPIRMDYAGQYTCSASSGPVKASKDLDVTVVSYPQVVISPSSKTVMAGDTIEMECSLNSSQYFFYNFVWYQNGRVLVRDHGETLVYRETSQVLIVPGIRNTTEFGCEGVNKWGTGKRVYSYIGVIQTQFQSKPTSCPAQIEDGKSWPLTAVDSYSILDCDPGHTGQIIRFCKSDGEFTKPIYNCLKKAIAEIKNKLEELQDGVIKANLSDIVKEMVNETSNVDLHQTDMEVMLDAMDIVSNTTDPEQAVDTKTGETESENFLQIASNMIDQQNRDTWVNRIDQGKSGAIEVPVVVESYIMKKTDGIMPNATTTFFANFNVTNIYTEVGRNEKTSYNLPIKSAKSPKWMNDSGTEVEIDAASLSGVKSDYVTFSSSFYRNVTDMLAKTLKRNGHTENFTDTMDVNADIVSVEIKEITSTFSPPVRIHFQHFNSNYSNPVCAYWSDAEKSFLTDGCSLESTSDYKTVCACNHFTNFAVLMSPGKTPSSDVLALSVISAVGCAISIFCLMVTVGTHVLVWRMIKNDRVIMLLNLCIALIISYIVFLSGVRQTVNKAACSMVSVLLHYLYLSVFCLMLAYGVEVAVSVLYVFSTRSRLKPLLALAWGVPAILVAMSLGTTKAEGYGTEDFCWLAVDSGLLWAFVAPAVVVIAVNSGIVIAVLVKMFRTRAMMQKTEKEKVKVAARSLVVLLPIFGLTWVFGVFSVNESLVAFQYIFAICNSLQGFFIFLFHCLLNPQVTDALKKLRERRKSLATFESDFKHKRFSGNVSTSETKSENKDKNGLLGKTNSAFEDTEQKRAYVNISNIDATINDDEAIVQNAGREQGGDASNSIRNTKRNIGATVSNDTNVKGVNSGESGPTGSIASRNRSGDRSPSVSRSVQVNQRMSDREPSLASVQGIINTATRVGFDGVDRNRRRRESNQSGSVLDGVDPARRRRGSNQSASVLDAVEYAKPLKRNRQTGKGQSKRATKRSGHSNPDQPQRPSQGSVDQHQQPPYSPYGPMLGMSRNQNAYPPIVEQHQHPPGYPYGYRQSSRQDGYGYW